MVKTDPKAPLAYRMRPDSLECFVGQVDVVGEGRPLRKLLAAGRLPTSIILWGPPGCGKTTLARMMANLSGYEFVELSAVNCGKKDITAAVNRGRLMGRRVLLFLDEIHRFNKAQQDVLLPFVEKGTITLVGATTENPSFEVNSALLSRSRVFVLSRLSEEEMISLIDRALNDCEQGFGGKTIVLDLDVKKLIAGLADGDARSCLNILELSVHLAGASSVVSREIVTNAVQKTHLHYDKNGEEHYNIISALHKSMRDSDVQASVYWCMRMIESGEDPKYIVRRMIRFASEDIGNADIGALQLAVSVKESVMFLGYPECNVALVQLAVYLAKAPKSNAEYMAAKRARRLIQETGALPVPSVIRNAVTGLMKDLGYGKGRDGKQYAYAHDDPLGARLQQHLPDNLQAILENGTSEEKKKLELYQEKDPKE